VVVVLDPLGVVVVVELAGGDVCTVALPLMVVEPPGAVVTVVSVVPPGVTVVEEPAGVLTVVELGGADVVVVVFSQPAAAAHAIANAVVMMRGLIMGSPDSGG
jgi:hypothetical protein